MVQTTVWKTEDVSWPTNSNPKEQGNEFVNAIKFKIAKWVYYPIVNHIEMYDKEYNIGLQLFDILIPKREIAWELIIE